MSPTVRFVVTAIYAYTSQIFFLIWQNFALTLPPLVFVPPLTPDTLDNGVPIIAGTGCQSLRCGRHVPCLGGSGELVANPTALFSTLFYNDSMFSTSSSLTDTLREIKMSPMYTLELSDSENFVPEKSLRTWNIVISNPQYRVCLRCEPGTS